MKLVFLPDQKPYPDFPEFGATFHRPQFIIHEGELFLFDTDSMCVSGFTINGRDVLDRDEIVARLED